MDEAKPTGPELLTDDECNAITSGLMFDDAGSFERAIVRATEKVILERCRAFISAAQRDSFAQQQGALLWIACMVDKCGGTVVLSAAEQLRAKELILERGDLEDGTTVLRTEEPPRIELATTEIAVASKKIILAS